MKEFFELYENYLTLKKPYRVVIKKDILESIFASYSDEVERGGVMLATIKKNANDGLVLEVEKAIELANNSDDIYYSFQPNKKEFDKYLEYMEEEIKKFVIPYHTHPVNIFKNLQNLSKILEDVVNERPSEKDFEEMYHVFCTEFQDWIHLPEIMITKNMQDHFIAYFYGKGTGYSDYDDFLKISSNSAEFMVNVTQTIYGKVKDFWNKGMTEKILTLLSFGTFAIIIWAYRTKISPTIFPTIISGVIFFTDVNDDSLKNPILVKNNSFDLEKNEFSIIIEENENK